MQMQTNMPKIKLAPSGAKSNTPSPRVLRSRRQGSFGKPQLRSLKTERFGETPHEPNQFLSREPRGSLKPLPEMSSTLAKSNFHNNNSLEAAPVRRLPRSTRVSTSKGEHLLEKKMRENRSGSSYIEESGLALDKMAKSKGFQLHNEKILERTESLANKKVDTVPYENTDSISSRTGVDTNDPSLNRKMQKLPPSIAKAAANIDSLSDDELIEVDHEKEEY